ncbi:MAG: patatin-like phospholipase family protein [Acidimicrobiia bacterium]
MPYVGLVLGAGGLVGGAYHAGALAALAEVTGWDARAADLVVGTSAGSVAGAALRAGLSPADHFARATGTPLSAAGQRLVGDDEGPSWSDYPLIPRALMPAAPQLAAALFPPWNPRPMIALAGLMPAGSVPTEPIGERVRGLYGGRSWPDEALWICALRLGDGARVVFGRDTLDPASTPDVGTAVEASSAIPGFFRPVAIGGRTYVDGGAHSPSNADLVAGIGLDLAVVVSTMSSARSALRPIPNMASRALASWALDRELRQVRASGTPVLLLEPTAEDTVVMGANSMNPKRRRVVAEQARRSTIQRLEHPAAANLVSRLAA